jgi:type II secretory pathway component PulM
MTQTAYPDAKPAAEYCDADLVDLALQIYARSFVHPDSEPLHDRWVECRKELIERFARLNAAISEVTNERDELRAQLTPPAMTPEEEEESIERENRRHEREQERAYDAGYNAGFAAASSEYARDQ